MRVCNCSMFCCTLLYVHSSIAIILMGKRELIALLNLSSWCLVKVEQLFLAVPRGCLQFVIVVFPDHTHLLFLTKVPPDLFLMCIAAKITIPNRTVIPLSYTCHIVSKEFPDPPMSAIIYVITVTKVNMIEILQSAIYVK